MVVSQMIRVITIMIIWAEGLVEPFGNLYATREPQENPSNTPREPRKPQKNPNRRVGVPQGALSAVKSLMSGERLGKSSRIKQHDISPLISPIYRV